MSLNAIIPSTMNNVIGFRLTEHGSRKKNFIEIVYHQKTEKSLIIITFLNKWVQVYKRKDVSAYNPIMHQRTLRFCAFQAP